MHDDLLRQARRLANLDKRKPKQANLRRAISSAYYGLFHFLSDQTCRMIVGTRNDQRAYRHVLQRALNHGGMQGACRSFAGGTLPGAVKRGLPATFTIQADLQELANTFLESQEKRHLADYDLTERFSRSDVLALVRQIDTAVRKFRAIPNQTSKRFFLGCLLTWNTLAHRK